MKLFYLLALLSLQSLASTVCVNGDGEYLTSKSSMSSEEGYKIATDLALANAAEQTKVMVGVDKDLVRTGSSITSRTTTSIVTAALMEYKVIEKYAIILKSEPEHQYKYRIKVAACYEESQQKYLEEVIAQNDKIASQLSELKLIQDKMMAQTSNYKIDVYNDEVLVYNKTISDASEWIKEQQRKYIASSVGIIEMQQQTAKQVIVNQYNAVQKFNEMYTKVAKLSVSDIKATSFGLDGIKFDYNIKSNISFDDMDKLANILTTGRVVKHVISNDSNGIIFRLADDLPEYIMMPTSNQYSVWKQNVIELKLDHSSSVVLNTVHIKPSEKKLYVRANIKVPHFVTINTNAAKIVAKYQDSLLDYQWR